MYCPEIEHWMKNSVPSLLWDVGVILTGTSELTFSTADGTTKWQFIRENLKEAQRDPSRAPAISGALACLSDLYLAIARSRLSPRFINVLAEPGKLEGAGV
jgi:hypothetical protein